MNLSTHYLIVKQSDIYPASHFRSGLFAASLILMLVYFLPFHWEDPIWLLYIEVSAFFIGYLLAYSKKVKRFFTFRGEMREEVQQKALESMREYGISAKDSTIFLFASQSERCLTCVLSPNLEESEEEKKVQKLLKKLIKEKKQQLRSGLNRDLVEEILAAIIDVFPKNSTTEIETNSGPVLLDAEDTKTSSQGDSPAELAPVEETPPIEKVDEKTDSKEENQSPEA